MKLLAFYMDVFILRTGRVARGIRAMTAEDKPPTSSFDPADFLENGDAILGYLTDALASGDPAFIDDALDVSVRAAKRLGTIAATNLPPSDYEAFFAGLGAGAELSEELQSAVARFRARTVSLVTNDADLFKERLRADLRQAFSADETTFKTLDAGQIIDRNRK
ncbi:MAG: hypothetical protein KDJ96_03915 [Rhodobacteraceae bacterium]|nr:hypothetical protein [Paracoccaceae bacterium]